mmetsp:Transcript_34143/g.32569  ORF Transcript_34143/g.32569 Transcript_34143/m.32569 type:complete len:522 (+) Transcript_34143:207-1772(+)|eukprot:CAMPEP_0119040238 /NCGR_PEP_ID=MMETSP1177-20130426/10100_1 /TAXON_ID=2985 /ORGANISM="Ochromonas sp, Strain CCMP1899" /LENGTH=521 /DNA_ID=CAMNT_0007005087 /DNA_START=168 /DNA_END=1733 /DNA_ORIENTATION=+
MSAFFLSTAVTIFGPIAAFLESISYIGINSHIIKLDYFDATYVQPIADGLGQGLPLVKYTLSLFLAYPFAIVLRALPNKHIKHLFSFLGGLFLVQWVFGPEWIHSIVSSGVTYLICALAPRKYAAILVFVWAMSYMTGSHLYRMYVSYLSGIFDFTGTQMVLTMKLTSFAYNLHDGTADHEKVFSTKHEDKKKIKMYGDRKKFAITALPNPIEFFGYIYCFTCLLAGPAFEYNDYVKSIDGSIFIKDDDKDKKATPPPSSVLPAIQRLITGVVCLAGHLVISGKAPIPNVYNLEWIAAHGHVQRLSYLFFALMGERLKYYFAWKVAEGASILGGFGFEGYDGEGKVIGWKGVENVDILAFEVAPNIQVLSRAWNKRTQGWLERYTYLRAGRSLVATYMISAIWHGLYPGFFLFFMSVPLMTNIERLIKSKINPIVVPGYDGYKITTYPKTVIADVYWYGSWFCTTVTMNYVVQVFSMSSLQRCMTALGSYYHIPHIALVVVYVLLELAPTPKKLKIDTKSN